MLVCFLLILPLAFTVSVAQEEDERGNLIHIISDKVSPSNFAEYEQWIKEFKMLADETGAPSYGVARNEDGMSYFQNVGKDMAGIDEMDKKWNEWSEANPKSGELWEKYSHTLTSRSVEIWRGNPGQSYYPEGWGDDNVERPYTRVDFNWLKIGHGAKAREVIAEYKAEWTKQGISSAVGTFWNVTGVEQPCVAFVSWYENRDAWLKANKEIGEKVGEERLNELSSKWNALIRKSETRESWDRSDLEHQNTDM